MRPRAASCPGCAALRADAFEQFEAAGLPNRRVEEWKYTDLRALMREAYPLAPPPDAAAKQRAKGAGDILAGTDCRRLVFVDGAFAPDLSDLAPEPGLTIGSLAEALAKGDALVTTHVGKTFATDDAAVALNTALMGDGAVIRSPRTPRSSGRSISCSLPAAANQARCSSVRSSWWKRAPR